MTPGSGQQSYLTIGVTVCMRSRRCFSGLRAREAVARAGLSDPGKLAVRTPALERDPATVVAAVLVALTCAHNFPRRLPRAYVRMTSERAPLSLPASAILLP